VAPLPEYAVPAFQEKVHRERQRAFQGPQLHAEVGFLGLLPGYVHGIVAYVQAVVIVVRILTKGIAVSACHGRDIGKTAAANAAVAHNAVGAPELQELYHIAERPEKTLVGGYPAHAIGRKKAETLVFAEGFRAVVTEVELCQVALIIGIGGPGSNALVAVGNGADKIPGKSIGTVALVVQDHA